MYNNFAGLKHGQRQDETEVRSEGRIPLSGEQLTLDFLNTRPVQNGESIELLPDFSTLLRWFQAAGLLSSLEAANLKLKMGRIGPSPEGCGVHEGTAGKIEKRDHRVGRRWCGSRLNNRRTQSIDGEPSHARQTEGKWKRALDRVVKTADVGDPA